MKKMKLYQLGFYLFIFQKKKKSSVKTSRTGLQTKLDFTNWTLSVINNDATATFPIVPVGQAAQG